jgi:RNA polymerase sigma factor (sigma-70 family)
VAPSASILDKVEVPTPDARLDILDLHDALERLAAFDARKSAIVELHFFGGLSYGETAETVGVSAATVDRELRMAKAWLKVELDRGTDSRRSRAEPRQVT